MPLKFGPYEVAVLKDGVFEAPANVLTHRAGPEARQRALQAWGEGGLRVDVNCFLLRGEDGLTMIDAGTGEAWGPKFGHAREVLRAHGVAPEAVARVLLTHIHGDHALGLFSGESAYFPNAEIWAPARDFAFFTDPQARESVAEARRGGFAIAERIARIYGDRVKRIADGPILPAIEAVPLPGHTPGHTGYLLRGADGSALIWGDVLHVGDLQPRDPNIGVVFDLAPETAARTRRDTLERAAREGWIVAGGHVSGFSWVLREGEGYRLTAA